ncbi:MAG: hypothetical protein ACR2JD_06815 [Nocardioides sp.]
MRFHRAALSAGFLVALVLLAACTDGVDTPAKPSTEPTSLSDCATLLPEGAVDSLGWAAEGAPTLDESLCRQAAAEGAVSVQRRLVAAGSEEEVPDAAQQAFDDRCAELGGMVGEPAGEEVDWLGEDARACVALAEGETGTTALIALWPDSTLVEVRVDADQPVSPERVRATLVELAGIADANL